ncbi:hypothetical protein LX36DRAFT_195480 [Colletotrichum falcatum]|nr:hypothetical protein LX36DRAFT_195480 [Colletotrichum falcatum]
MLWEKLGPMRTVCVTTNAKHIFTLPAYWALRLMFRWSCFFYYPTSPLFRTFFFFGVSFSSSLFISRLSRRTARRPGSRGFPRARTRGSAPRCGRCRTHDYRRPPRAFRQTGPAVQRVLHILSVGPAGLAIDPADACPVSRVLDGPPRMAFP